jgi:hypothetical protein
MAYAKKEGRTTLSSCQFYLIGSENSKFFHLFPVFEARMGLWEIFLEN